MPDKERLIYRPNHIPLEEWENLDRDAQIAYWKNREKKRVRSRPTMLKVVELYEQGALTFQTCFIDLCSVADADQIDEFIELCPSELLDKIREKLSSVDDVDTFRFGGFSTYPPWTTSEEIEKSESDRLA